MNTDIGIGKGMTVKEPIDLDRLDTTLMHERLFQTDFLLGAAAPDENTATTELTLWDQKLALHNLLSVQQRTSSADNWVLADQGTAIEEAMEFCKMSIDTMVEVTSIGLRRAPIALRRVSVATGLNVVMGSGCYQKVFHPAGMAKCRVEELADEIIRDITVASAIPGSGPAALARWASRATPGGQEPPGLCTS